MSAEWLNPIGLMVLGYVLLFIELGVLPGFGIPGIMGLIALVSGCYELWQSQGPLVGSLGTLISLGIAVFVTVRFARSRSGQALVLDDEISGSASPTDQLAPLIGCAAVVSATLRPSGVVTIDGSRYDAMVRDGGFVEAEALVVVVAQEHGQLVVERPSEHNA